jgi:predicted kinase
VKIVFVVGLPGSGKTHLAKQMSETQGLVLLDDLNSLDNLFGVLASQDSCVITDPNLCDPSIRAKAVQVIKSKFDDVQLEWIFFENSPEKCRKNIQYRNDGRNVEATLLRFTKVYDIPEGHVAREIWNDSN